MANVVVVSILVTLDVLLPSFLVKVVLYPIVVSFVFMAVVIFSVDPNNEKSSPFIYENS